MKRNLRIGTKTYTDIDKVIVTDADTEEAVTVVDTSDATAVNISILQGYTGYADDKLITGTAQELDTSDLDAFLFRSVTDFTTNATSIKAYFAYLYSTLASITAPNVLSVGNYAFYNAGSTNYLTSVYLPSVTTIGDYAFCYRTQLTSLDLPSIESIGSNAFYNCTGLQTINIKTATSIGTYAFYNCTSLTEIDLSDDLTSISAYAFYNTAKATSVTAKGVTSVEKFAFWQTSTTNALTTIDMPKLQTISSYAFYRCSAVTSSNFFDTVTGIGDYGLRYFGNSSSTSFEWNNTKETVISAGTYGLANSAISRLSGKWNVTGNYAFAYCYKLTDVDIDLDNNSISNYSFLGDSALTNVRLTNCTGIYSYGFSSCTAVATFDVSASILTRMDGYACYRLGCSRENYESSRLLLDFSNSTFTTAGNYTFAYTNYTDIILPAVTDTIAAYEFYGAMQLNIYLPGELCAALSGTSAFGENTTSRVFVNYNVFNAYRTATNWSDETILSYLHPYAPAGTFEAGVLLPELNSEGYEVTWYSDVELTTQITTMPEESVHIYCSIGQEQVGYPVAISCRYGNVAVSNGIYTYKDGDTIRPNTTITITFKPETPYIYGYKVSIDGASLYSKDSEIDLTDFVYEYTTGDAGLIIEAIYWDGINSPYIEYGIRWRIDQSDPAGERIIKQLSKITAWDITYTPNYNTVNENPFEEIPMFAPTEWTDDLGNVFMRWSQFYIKRETTDEYEYIWICADKADEDYRLPQPFYDGRTDGTAWTYVDIGKYEGSIITSGDYTVLASKSGVALSATQSISNLVSYATNNAAARAITNGDAELYFASTIGVIADIYQVLFPLMLGTRDVQAYYFGISASNTTVTSSGATDTLDCLTGTIGSTASSSNAVKICGIENPFGNYWETLVDIGLYNYKVFITRMLVDWSIFTTSNTAWVETDMSIQSNFNADDANYIISMGAATDYPDLYFPTKASTSAGSSTTYYTDNVSRYSITSTPQFVRYGGNSGNWERQNGLFALLLNVSASSGNTLYTRLSHRSM